MRVARTKAEVREFCKDADNVGLVPTMGAFHEGHLTLMRQCRQTCATTVVSLFVNPTQFGPNEDFDRYPRDESTDFEFAEAEGVDLVFAPDTGEVYDTNRQTNVIVPDVTERYEGTVRPGHFEGVATVVLKLFNIVRPNAAFFGLKDLQQCAVIQKMVRDLDVNIALHFSETVREPDGLAMSSRNVRLSASDRAVANQLYRVLGDTASAMRSSTAPVEQLVLKAKGVLTALGFGVDYLDLVDPTAMAPLEAIGPGSRLIVAARLGIVRLIDNIPV